MGKAKSEKELERRRELYKVNREHMLEQEMIRRQSDEYKQKKHEYYLKNREHIIKKSKDNKNKNAEKYRQQDRIRRQRPDFKKHSREYARERWQRIKKETLNHYGGKCLCCEEAHIEFLSIDHINGNGTQHRKTTIGTHIYDWLRRNNYPEGYRVLCFNCNMSLGFFSYCPHGGLNAIKIESK
jgi:hypothetical protein